MAAVCSPAIRVGQLRLSCNKRLRRESFWPFGDCSAVGRDYVRDPQKL
jgi:hypothetical protein